MSKINVRGGKDLISYGFLYWRNYKIKTGISRGTSKQRTYGGNCAR